MNLAAKVPNGMLDSWNGLNKFLATNIAPVASWSGGVVSSAANVFKTQRGSDNPESMSPGERFGTSEEVAKQIEKLQMKYFFAEDTSAANEDARLCLKKGTPADWGACEDYEEYVRNLVKQEQSRIQDGSCNPKLKVRVFFAESDIMIGKGGQKYFEQCWEQDDVAQSIDYEGMELPETDHDTAVLDQKKGALRIIFEEIKRTNQY